MRWLQRVNEKVNEMFISVRSSAHSYHVDVHRDYHLLSSTCLPPRSPPLPAAILRPPTGLAQSLPALHGARLSSETLRSHPAAPSAVSAIKLCPWKAATHEATRGLRRENISILWTSLAFHVYDRYVGRMVQQCERMDESSCLAPGRDIQFCCRSESDVGQSQCRLTKARGFSGWSTALRSHPF